MSEVRIYPIQEHLAKKAHIGGEPAYREMYERSIQDPEGFWGEMAAKLDWFHPWREVMHADFHQAEARWFAGGRINACYNCVDRHLGERRNDVALIWAKDEPGEYQRITYQELHDNVCRVANALLEHGVKKGDRVCLYLPMMPELAYTMLACARIGAVHSVVFAGFSAQSLKDRIEDAGATVVVTANEGLRGGKVIPLKGTVNIAVKNTKVHTVLVAHRTDTEVSMQQGRDFSLEDAMARERASCPVEWMDAEDPLFVLYTSGSTGKPKGLQHTTAGYLLQAMLTFKWVFDYHPGDVYACVADIGWITGHTYILYGPLANGATSVMFESTPTYPDAGRYWQLVDDLGVRSFYTAPTALRAIHRFGDEFVTKYSRKTLEILGTVGEPINPEVWEWYHEVVGDGRCAIVDTYWQTETGGHMLTPLPGATPCKPGAAGTPFFGVKPELVDDQGQVVEGNDVRGNLCIAGPWPGMARTIHEDHQRFHQTYFAPFAGRYFTGDGAHRDADGFYWITGRVDDVINVSGHRMGTAEVESALVAHDFVAEAAVVGCPHEVKGQGIYCYVIPTVTAENLATDEVIKTLKNQVRSEIGPIATPDHIQVVPGLPKTRSGKIMRRILRKVAEGEYGALGDTSTLADPSVVEAIVDGHKNR